MNKLPKHYEAGPQRRWDQCTCSGCIGFMAGPALINLRTKHCWN